MFTFIGLLISILCAFLGRNNPDVPAFAIFLFCLMLFAGIGFQFDLIAFAILGLILVMVYTVVIAVFVGNKMSSKSNSLKKEGIEDYGKQNNLE